MKRLFKIISIFILGLSVTLFLYYFVQIGSTVFNHFENPLVPKYLWKFAVFPKVILSILFVLIGIYCFKSFKKNHYNTFMVWALFVYSVLFIFIGSYVYEFINSFNPYA